MEGIDMEKMYLKKFAKGQALGHRQEPTPTLKDDVLFALSVFVIVLFACAVLFI